MNSRRFVMYIFYTLLGVLLLGLGMAGIVDEFWTGMGSAFLILGVLRMVQIYRFHKNEDYREKMETELNDERNRFIRNKAWAWAGYLFIIIAGVSTILLRIAGQELFSMVASGAVCLIMLLYWVSYLILRRKY